MGKYDWNSMKTGLQKGVGEKSDNNYDDPREWKLTVDENQNGTAVIRLLPGKGGTTAPIVRVFEHSIRVFNKKSNKYRYFINPSPSSIDQDCPASSLWYEMGDIGTDEAKKFQKDFLSRSTKFISNVLVVNDPGNPENNGKVFYWKYGVKMFEKFQKALEPTEAQLKVGKKGVELFDPMLGADIVIDAQKVAGFRNYDGSTVEAPSAAFATEAEADACVDEKCHDLTEFISADHYESYEKLLKDLRWALAGSPIEELALLNGSKIILEKHVDRAKGSSADSATPSAGSASKPKPTPEPTPEPEAQEPEPEAEVEVEKPKPKPKAKPKAESAPAGDDDILAMLDDL